LRRQNSKEQLKVSVLRRQLPITSKTTTLPYRYGSVEAKVFNVVVVAQSRRLHKMNRLEFAEALRCCAKLLIQCQEITRDNFVDES